MIQIQFCHRMLGKFIVYNTTQPDSLWYFSTLFQYCGAECVSLSLSFLSPSLIPRLARSLRGNERKSGLRYITTAAGSSSAFYPQQTDAAAVDADAVVPKHKIPPPLPISKSVSLRTTERFSRGLPAQNKEINDLMNGRGRG